MEKIKNIEHVKFDDAPEGWSDRCSGDGYERIINDDGDRVFADNNVSVGIGYRPCAKCKEYPTEEGHDTCLGELGGVMNACCGHGRNKGYIQFDNGITLRGNFEVERGDSFPLEYEMRPKQEILDKIHYLESLNKLCENPFLEALRWVMQIIE